MATISSIGVLAAPPSPGGGSAIPPPNLSATDDLPVFRDLGEVIAWAGLAGSMEEIGSDLETLLSTLRMSPSTPCRLLGALNEDQWISFLNDWLPGSMQPSAAQLAAAMLTYKVCHGRYSLSSSSLMAARPSDSMPSNPTIDAPTPRLAKLSTVVSQVSERSVPVLKRVDLDKAYALFVQTMGASPAAHEECSLEQLSAINCLLTEGAVPYVDFALWVPHHARMQKKLAFSGLIIGTDGVLRRAEIKGPSNFEQWMSSFKLLKTALI
eukprot:5137759-Amphidinium_carterae.1